ncbi:MAG: DUF4058 family protein [Armatimonadetes bacterium]|nr:DUF4058 family protein [Armatimonadota bacterium]
MPSPFPGMDPFLEGHLWPDFHHRMASEVARRLTAQLRPRYVARLELYIVEDPSPEAEIGIMYPDVELGTCVSTVYEDAAYELSLDYSREPPPPPLKEDEQQCLQEVRRVLLLD